MNKIFWIFLGALVAIAEFALAQDQSGLLTAVVKNFSHDRGQVVAHLFAEGSDVMKVETALKRVTTKIEDGQASFIFPDLKYGKYAISVFHDEDGNDDLKHSFFGFPTEPLGFSGGFKMSLFSGLPSFEKLQFSFSSGTDKIEINMK